MMKRNYEHNIKNEVCHYIDVFCIAVSVALYDDTGLKPLLPYPCYSFQLSPSPVSLNWYSLRFIFQRQQVAL